MQALQEEIHRGMNIATTDESEEFEEGHLEQEVPKGNPKKDRLLRDRGKNLS